MSPREVLKNLDKNITLSKYFTWGEALWLPKMRAYAVPTQEQINNIINLAQALDKVRDHYNKPMIVHSWLRPAEYNKLIGGARASKHIEGSAIDFSIDGLQAGQIQSELEKRKDIWPYRGERGTPTWVHLDLGAGPWFNP